MPTLIASILRTIVMVPLLTLYVELGNFLLWMDRLVGADPTP